MTEGIIKILPESLSNQIAAGEVIDRPSSVVKELAENAIDAGATEITIIVRDGGKTLIQVIDNGSGMIEADAILAFERHSTSKIHEVADLERILTLGFRGEALASIGSVARVELTSRIEEETAATQLLLEAGIIKELRQSAGKRGTSIAVKNLFFNTPARRKFLKSDPSEYRHILQVTFRYFLSYPEITFHFFKNEEEIFSLPNADLRQRIVLVHGEKFQNNLVNVNFEQAGSRITGMLGNMDLFRKSRGDQYLFLNRRYIQNKNLNWAVISAYQTMLPQGSFPFYTLFLHLNPEVVDVNVHPSKIEVKFEDERLVYGLIYRAVREALQSGEVVPVLHPETSNAEAEFETIPFTRSPGQIPMSERNQSNFDKSKSKLAFQFEFRKEKRELSLISGTKKSTQATELDKSAVRSQAEMDQVGVWQLHNKYILSQIKSGLLIIDQHLAHERILYEKALQLFKDSRPISQQLLFPKTVPLNADDFEILLEMQFYLTRLGFIVREFGKQTVIIEAIPAELRYQEEETMLREMIDDYKQNKEPDIREKIAKTFACKSAIKAGDRLNPDEIIALIDHLFATQNPYFCPHGRPIIVTFPIEDLDRRFLRI